jgi:general secretion pathway protein M
MGVASGGGEMKALRTQAMTRWHALSPRDQHGLTVLGALLGVLLFGSVAIAPALSTLRDSDNRRTQIGQQQAHMLALQAQAQTLQTRTALSRDEALRLLQGLTPNAQIQLNVQGDRVNVQIKAVPAPTLANWLAQARNQAQALPLEVHLTRSNGSGATSPVLAWDGSLVLTLPHRGSQTN